MKCPKCGYLGFEHVDRCRNCGYDFSLIKSIDLPELPIRSDETRMAPLEDLALADAGIPSLPRAPVQPSSELPLFGTPIFPSEPDRLMRLSPMSPMIDDEPLIGKPSAPRPPLAVRRSTPEVPRLRAGQPRFQSLELDLDVPVMPAPGNPPRSGERDPE